MFDRKTLSAWTMMMCVACAIGCSIHKNKGNAGSGPAAQSSAVPESVYYPLGRWRLAPAEDLSRSIVWLSHIVVMHKDSKPGVSGLRPEGWAPDSIPERSREAAYRIALTAQAEARANPSGFAAVAHKYSDDVVTRDHGGSLGGVHATDLAPVFLDALSALQPGQVSNVFESKMGFHVILSRRPPPLDDVSGARVVVRYRSTSGPAIERTREEALARAAELVAKARSGVDFETLARNESDGPDRVRGGAMGVWSTREPRTENAQIVEALSALPEGGISEPLDSPSGFQIVKRLAPGAPAEFAVRLVKIPVAVPIFPVAALGAGLPARPSGPDPQLAEAERIAGTLRRNPEEFPRILAGRCCRSPQRWVDGHGDPILTSSIEGLRIGEVTPSPVRVDDYYVVAQRIDPESACPRPRPILGLPAPSSIDLEVIVRGNDSAQLASEIASLGPIVSSLGLSQSEQSAFAGSLERFRAELPAATTPEARVLAYRQSLNRIRASVSESAYSRVVSLIETWASARMLGLSVR